MSRSNTSRSIRVRAAALGAGLAVAVLPLGASVASAGTATAPNPTSTPRVCKTGTLPASVIGRPAVKPGLPAGVWVWHDARGWHLRATHDTNKKVVFTGTIHSSGRIWAQPVKFERHDQLWRNHTHTTVAFKFRNHGFVDGVNFQVGCAKTIRIALKLDGVAMPTSQIHLGSTGVSPTSNPFVIERS